MGKKATMFKALAAGLLALVFVLATPAGGTQAEAAQFSGNEFGVGFAGEEYATMHKADGWSNGGMFNCTWRAANIWFDGYLNIKITEIQTVVTAQANTVPMIHSVTVCMM